MAKINKSVGYISVEPEFVVNLARQLFHFEQKEFEAFELLSCFRGITNDQIRYVLNGDAKLISSSKGAKFIKDEDIDLKTQIEAHGHYIDSKMFMIAGYRIPKDLLNEYVDETVLRLRATMTQEGVGLLMNDPLMIMELEERREKLHNEILATIRIKRGNQQYHIFAQALDNYVTKRQQETKKEAESKYFKELQGLVK